MRIIESIKRIYPYYGKIGLTIGNFEGFHRGHVQIIRSLIFQSKKRGLFSTVITFKEHPLKVIRNVEPERLMVPNEKIVEFENEGIDLLIYMNFSKEFAHTEPAAFLKLLSSELSPKLFCLGSGFRFGRDNAGNIDWLSAHDRRWSYDLFTVADVVYAGVPVSSTRIRDAIKKGEFPLVRHLLGRNYHVWVSVDNLDPLITKTFVPHCALPERGKFICDLVGDAGENIRDLKIKRNEDGLQILDHKPIRKNKLYKLYFKDLLE